MLKPTLIRREISVLLKIFIVIDNSFPRPPETLKDDYETVIDSNNDYSSSDNDSLYSDDINYVEASPPDSELVSLEVVENENGDIDTHILLTIKDDILRDQQFLNSLPEYETFCFNLEEKSSGNPTSYTGLSLPNYEAFFYDSEPNSGDFTMDSFVIKSPIPVEDVFDTLLPFSFENEEKYFNPGSLSSNEAKSPLFAYVVWIFLPFLTIASDFEASHARGFVLRSLELQHPQLHIGNPISKSYRLTFIFEHT
ncbi:hypothetical protein Tco_0216373 [Tanacetum coccineum]